MTFLGAPREKAETPAARRLMGVSVVAWRFAAYWAGIYAAVAAADDFRAVPPLPLETAHTTVSRPMIALQCGVATAVHHYGDVQGGKSAVAFSRRGTGVRLRPCRW
ncbi:hypothetical protein KCP69_08610 [Salmonella enterica subsp. enterica]|nr:hypothetical protein KCP69_08610 [Salmonella enterica subsp. enterica]